MMTSILILQAIAMFLWCYTLVLGVAWFRAVGAEDRRTHVGHFVSLMAVFVPISCSFVLFTFLCAYLQIAELVLALFVLVPAGLVLGLQLEVSRLTGSTDRLELTRLGTTACLFGAILLWQGGL